MTLGFKLSIGFVYSYKKMPRWRIASLNASATEPISKSVTQY